MYPGSKRTKSIYCLEIVLGGKIVDVNDSGNNFCVDSSKILNCLVVKYCISVVVLVYLTCKVRFLIGVSSISICIGIQLKRCFKISLLNRVVFLLMMQSLSL